MSENKLGLSRTAPLDYNSGMNAPTTQSKTLQANVYTRLKEALWSGKIMPGAILTIRGLAQTLGTSSMPVREALQRLETQGALQPLANGSVCVPLKSPERFLELCDVRMLLEGEAAFEAAERIQDSDLKRIKRSNARFESAMKAGKASDALKYNEEFHFAIYAAARNETLSRLIDMLWLQSGPYVAVLFDYYALGSRFRRDAIGHTGAISALEGRDSRAARQAIRRDIMSSVKSYREFTKKTGPTSSIWAGLLATRSPTTRL